MRRYLAPGVESEAGGGAGASAVHEIEVNGEILRLTTEQLRADAARYRAQTPALQSNLDKLKNQFEEYKRQAEPAVEFVTDLKTVIHEEDGADEAASRIGSAFDLSAAEAREWLMGRNNGTTTNGKTVNGRNDGRRPSKAAGDRFMANPPDDEDENDDDGAVRQQPQPPVRRTVTLDDLDPAMRRDFDEFRKTRLAKLRDSQFANLDQFIQSDATLADLAKNGPGTGKAIANLARQALRRRVGLERQELTPETFRQVVEETKALLGELGVEKAKPSAAILGLGPGDEEMIEQLHRDQRPPQRVSVSEGDAAYRDSFRRRVVAKVAEAGGLTESPLDAISG